MVSCKVPQAELLELLTCIQNENMNFDSSVSDTRFEGIKLVQTTDFFYPLIEDPFMQGKITCANVLSDIYAMGIVHIDNVLMLLAVSMDMPVEWRNIVTPLLMKGFVELAEEAGTKVTGGQTVRNPWYILGGVATSIVKQEEMILPVNCVPGDTLILTKPLGTQVIVNAFTWMDTEKWNRIDASVTQEQVKKSYEMATYSMARLNRIAAMLMHKYNAHGATDVTGFGILGHAINLSKNQKTPCTFHIHTLPLLPYTDIINQKVDFQLTKGTSAETSGGLLIALPSDLANAFIQDIYQREGWHAWVVGEVLEKKDDCFAFIDSEPKIVIAEH